MNRCKVKAYEGTEKNIFISYSHKDTDRVFPVLERLEREGYRIWYDEGIDPGTEWPEIIASHLEAATVCVAFISANSLASHNCRREINYAIMKKKAFVSVMLEPVELSPGMEMQLSVLQSVFRYAMPEEEFYRKLFLSDGFASCKANKQADASDEKGPETEPKPTEQDGTARKRRPWLVFGAVALLATAVFGAVGLLATAVFGAVGLLAAAVLTKLRRLPTHRQSFPIPRQKQHRPQRKNLRVRNSRLSQ